MIGKTTFILTAITILLAWGTPSKACINLPCDLEEVAETLKQPELSQFKQEKKVQVLSQPLFSEGYLLLHKDKKLVWQTIKPIKSTTVITNSELLQFNKKDELLSLPKNTENASGKVIATTFMNILAGDLNKLEDNFQVELSCNKEEWNINLIPSATEASKLLKHINIQGSKTIRQVTFTESNNDITRLVFEPYKSAEVKRGLGQYLEY